MNTTSSNKSYRVPALEKALEVLEFVARSDSEGMTQSEIAEGIGRSFHEVYRIIRVLLSKEYLERDPDSGRIILTFKLLDLAYSHPPFQQLSDTALPVMRKLALSISQSCHLAVLRGGDAVIVMEILSPLPMRYSIEIGSRFPVLESGSGRTILAFLEKKQSSDLLTDYSSQVKQFGGRTAITNDLERIRNDGYDIRESFRTPGINNISYPVRDHFGDVVAALTVPYLDQKGIVANIAEATKATGKAAAKMSGTSIRRGVFMIDHKSSGGR